MTIADFHSGHKTNTGAVARAIEGYDGRIHTGAVLGAIIPALTILMVAAAILVAWQ